MKTKIILSCLIFVFLANASFAETTIKAQVDKASITTDDVLTYKISISSSDKNIPQLQLPKLDDFSVISQTQSSNVSFVQGGIKTEMVYEFTLAPNNIGKFTIGPSSIKINNQAISAESFSIEVTQGRLEFKKPPLASKEPQYTL